MEELNETKIYNSEEFNDAYVLDCIMDVVSILKERGYDPIKQIVGYLISGDPGYITSYKDARKKIQEFDRIRILEVMVKKSI